MRSCQARFVLSLFSALPVWASIASGQNVQDGFDPGITNTVTALAVQADGKILVGGEFLSVNGVACTNLARLNPDGTPDTSFDSRTLRGFQGSGRHDLILQKDGKILANASYVNPAGQRVTGLVRLMGNGELDAGFYSATNGGAIALQADGRILVSPVYSGIFRLETNGDFDPDFSAIEPGFPYIFAMLEQPDRKILAAGGALAPGYQIVRRFHPDGARDTNFNAAVRLPFSIVEYSYVGATALQRDGRVLIGGWFSFVNEQPRGDFARLNRDGSLDTNFFPGPYEQLNSGSPRDIVVQPDGRILVLTTTLRRHLPDGRPDPNFKFLWNGSADSKCVALQPDGKILLGGLFTSSNGALRRGLIRLYPDGTLDADFVRPAVSVRALAIQSDGRLVVGAYGSSIEGGFTGNFLGRYGINGQLDASFQPGVNTNMHAVCVQTDGRIAIAGQFYRVGGAERLYAARVDATGSLDTNFNPGLSTGPSEWAWALAQQDDGKLLMAGSFSTVSGQPYPKLARLQTNGSVDGTFSSAVFASTNCADCFSVSQIFIQPDGKQLVSGTFKLLDGGGRTNLARLNSNGSLDAGFRPAASGRILALQRDGRVLVAQGGTTLLPNRLVRLNSDGSLDPGFTSSVSGNVSAAAVQADGRVVVTAALNAPSGDEVVLRLKADGTEDLTFARVDDGFLFPDGIALQFDGKILVHGPFGVRRVSNPTAALQSITLDLLANELTWHRGGSSPEVERVVFERSLDGTNYVMMGLGIPSAEGWRMTNAAIPLLQNIYIRVRGRLSTGWNKASSSLVESVVQFHVGLRELPRLILTGHAPGASGFVQYHFANPLGLRFGLVATINLFSPEYLWQKLRDPELDFFDVEGRYWFWEPTTNATRFYKLTPP